MRPIQSTLVVGIAVLSLLTHPVVASAEPTKAPDQAEDVKPLPVGKMAPNVTLKTLEDKPTTLAAAFNQKPTVLIFFRGQWCPFCTRQLAGLAEVYPKLQELGYQMIAIAPDSPQNLKKMHANASLNYTLLADTNYEAILNFQVAFKVEPNRVARQGKYLPVPTVYLIDAKGKITFLHFDPNYRKRISADALFAAAKKSQS